MCFRVGLFLFRFFFFRFFSLPLGDLSLPLAPKVDLGFDDFYFPPPLQGFSALCYLNPCGLAATPQTTIMNDMILQLEQ